MAGNVISGAPNIIPGPRFGAPHFYQDPYQQQYAYEPQPQQPSFMQQLALGVGGGLGEGISAGIKNQLRQSLVNKALSMIPENASPEQTYRSLLQVDAETRQEVLPLLELRQAQQQAQAQQREKSVQREHELSKIRLQNQGRIEAAQSKKSSQPDVVQKKLQEATAKEIAETFHEIPRLEGTRATLNRLRTLSKNLKGVKGYAQAIGNVLGMGGQDAAEFNALGLASIEPVIKIFNPTGAISTEKLKIIRDRIAPTAFDTVDTMEGKIKALERLTTKAENRATKIQRLYEQYGDSIPPKELLKMNRENEAILDKFLETQGISKETLDAEKLESENAVGFRRMTNPQTGETLDVPEEDVISAQAEGFR